MHENFYEYANNNRSIYRANLNHDILSKEEEYKLINDAQLGNDESRHKLIENNLRLVSKVAYKFASSVSYLFDIDADDLMADGVIGLNYAIDRFDTTHDIRFSTYATEAIQIHIRRSEFLKDHIRIPEHMISRIKLIERAEFKLIKDMINPTAENISKIIGISVDKVEFALRIMHDVRVPISINTPIYNMSEDNKEILDTIASDLGYNEINSFEIKNDLEFYLSRLTDKERFILESYYGIKKKMNTKEIGNILGISRTAIDLIINRSIEKLKKLHKSYIEHEQRND